MHALLLLIALLLDALLGEPEWAWSRIPHPVEFIGKIIDALEKSCNRGENRRAKGILVVAGLAVAAFMLGALVAAVPDYGLLELLFAAILLSYKSLVEHVTAVADGLRINLSEGRREVAKLVGRDVEQMEQADVARAAIESAAENFSDGVIAPAFWFLLFGLPGIMVYKVVNTADSMIGYRDERFGEFGMAAARLDDILNWIPARISAVLIAVTNRSWKQFRAIRRDAALHRSPNAGWPEAALAMALDIALSGPRNYGGVRTDFPYVNPDGKRELSVSDIYETLSALKKSWIGLCVICAVLFLLS